MFRLALALAIAFLLQALLSAMQMKHFSNEFMKLRRRGKVVCGRQAGGFHAGAIVLFRIDGDGVIQESRKLEGVTCFARVKDLPGYEGRHIASLTAADLPKGHKNLGKAILDAALTYRKYTAGEELVQPPSPFQKAGRSVAALFQRKSTT